MHKINTKFQTKLIQKILYTIKANTKPSLRLPSFSHLNYHPKIHQYLQANKLHTPTFIQYAFHSELLNNPAQLNYHIISPTGSGKTLSYLLPIMNSLRQEEDIVQAQLTLSKRPRAMIIVPNKQLILQVKNEGKKLSHFVKMKCEGINLGRSLVEESKLIEDGVDVLITTFQRVNRMLDKQNIYLSYLKWLVIDQSDTLNDCNSLKAILEKFRNPIFRKQSEANQSLESIPPKLILVSTTNPPNLSKFVKQTIPDIKVIIDHATHLNLQNIKHQFVHCQTLDKHNPTITLLKRQRQTKTMIFCNTVKSLHELQYYLQSVGFKVATLHSQLPKQQRIKNYELFRDNTFKILLATDLGSRGLDFPDLQRIINYDFPLEISDYLHRAGRTGRAGKQGVCISLYHKKNLPVIEELRGASFNKQLKISNSAYALKNRNETGHPNKFKKPIKK